MVDRQQTYYQTKRELIKERQSEYYRKNGKEIRGKRVTHYKESKGKIIQLIGQTNGIL